MGRNKGSEIVVMEMTECKYLVEVPEWLRKKMEPAWDKVPHTICAYRMNQNYNSGLDQKAIQHFLSKSDNKLLKDLTHPDLNPYVYHTPTKAELAVKTSHIGYKSEGGSGCGGLMYRCPYLEQIITDGEFFNRLKDQVHNVENGYNKPLTWVRELVESYGLEL